jgi:2',3'-cyclic-nucleotide 2'-phosphodiesterase (5'-nucleotidase family)
MILIIRRVADMIHFRKSAMTSFRLFLFFLFSSSLLGPAFGEVRQPVDLTIIHINDFHGRLLPSLVKSVHETLPVGGAAYLAYMIREKRTKNPEGTLLLSAGDMFQGSAVSNTFRGEPVIEIMNYLKFDAMAIGNHEFDWGMDVLKTLRRSAAFPFLSANIAANSEDQKNGNLSWIIPYHILERKGLKIAVIGITTPETPYSTKQENVKDITFLDPEKVLPAIIREARAKGANFIILLSHSGLDADKRLAEVVPGINLIVGGHSHTAVMKPEMVSETIIVQAGYHGIYLGTLELKIEPDAGMVRAYTKEKELEIVYAGPENKTDERVEKIVNIYNDQLKESFAQVIGESSVDLVRNDIAESNIGNLVSDAIREATGADIAFESSGGIRTDLPRGKITREQVYGLLPFDDIVITMDLSGKQILEILEQSATLEKGMLQVSGITVVYDVTKYPGSRVVKVSVGNKPLEPKTTYRVAVNDFLAAGGDKFKTFKEGKNATYGDMARDIFLIFLHKHSPVSPGLEGRSVIVP